jgi:hypothetical protein
MDKLKDSNRAYYVRNKDAMKEYHREYNLRNDYRLEYRIRNLDNIRRFQREYYLRNKNKFGGKRCKGEDNLKEYRREYNSINKDAKRNYRLEYMTRNKDKIKGSNDEYLLLNNEVMRDYRRNYNVINKRHIRLSQREYYLQHLANPLTYSPRIAVKSWKSPELVREYFDSIVRQLSISDYSDWYRISRIQLAKLGGIFVCRCFFCTDSKVVR